MADVERRDSFFNADDQGRRRVCKTLARRFDPSRRHKRKDSLAGLSALDLKIKKMKPNSPMFGTFFFDIFIKAKPRIHGLQNLNSLGKKKILQKLSMTEIKKDCTTCIHEDNKQKCKCFNDCAGVYDYHEFKCDYCNHKLLETDKKFCECENDDGSQNCCGDHFEFNNVKFQILSSSKDIDSEYVVSLMKTFGT